MRGLNDLILRIADWRRWLAPVAALGAHGAATLAVALWLLRGRLFERP